MGITSSRDGRAVEQVLNDLPPTDDFSVYDNTTGRVVSSREEGTSVVQTVPDALCSILDVRGGMTPKIAFHTDANAIILIYESGTHR